MSVCKHYNPLSFSQFSFSHLEKSSFCIIADLRNYFTCNQILFSMCEILKMISSPYYTVSAPQCLWVSLDRLKQIDVILTLSLRHLKFFLQQFLWFVQLWSCFIKWCQKEQSRKHRIHNGGWHETSNLLHENKKRKHTLESVQYRLESSLISS